jgi:hypothetical protein
MEDQETRLVSATKADTELPTCMIEESGGPVVKCHNLFEDVEEESKHEETSPA